MLFSRLNNTQVVVVHAACSDELVFVKLKGVNLVPDRSIAFNWLKIWVSGGKLVEGRIIVILGHSLKA